MFIPVGQGFWKNRTSTSADFVFLFFLILSCSARLSTSGLLGVIQVAYELFSFFYTSLEKISSSRGLSGGVCRRAVVVVMSEL